MAAFRFHAIVKHIIMPRHSRGNKKFDSRLFPKVIEKCCYKMVGHVSNVRRTDVQSQLGNSETAWLCYEAFHRKLKKHPQMYANLLKVVTSLREDYENKMSREKVTKMRSLIGKRVPRSFRRMK